MSSIPRASQKGAGRCGFGDNARFCYPPTRVRSPGRPIVERDLSRSARIPTSQHLQSDSTMYQPRVRDACSYAE